MCQGKSLGLGSFPGKREVIESSVGLVPANTLFFRMANRSFAINCAVKLNPIPLQPADTRSFIFEHPQSGGNTGTDVRCRCWRPVDTEPSRTRAGLVLSQERIRLLRYGTPKLIFCELL